MNISEQENNVIRNSIWEFIGKLVSLFTPFLIRTIIIWKFGVEYLGLNNLFASVLQILNIAELGFGEAIVYNLYKPIAECNYDTINALLGFYKKVYRVIGILIICIGLCIMPFLPLLISDDVPGEINIYLLFIMSLISTGLSYLCYAYKEVLLNANQRKDVINKISLICVTFRYVVQILILCVTQNFYLYFSIDIFVSILKNVLIAITVKKYYPHFHENGKLDSFVKREIWSKVKGLMVYKLSGKTKNAVDSLVLSSFLGLTIVAQYGNYYYILNNIVVLLASITSGAQATIGNRMVLNAEDTNYRDFMNLTFVHSWISSVCCVCLFCLYQHFMEMWVGKTNMFPFYMVICFSLYFLMLSGCEVRNTYVNAAGLWWENRFRAIGSAVTNLALNLLFIKWLGLLGIILATMISIIFFDVIFTSRTLFKYYFKNQNIEIYFLWLGKQLVVTVIACAIMFGFCMLITHRGIIGFLIKAIICVLGANILLWLFYRKDLGFAYMKELIMRRLKKINGKKYKN